MASFENSVVVAKNVNFDMDGSKPHLGIINAAGKLPIGTGNAFPIPEILAGNIVSPNNSITFGYSSPNITAIVAGGSTTGQTITGDSGGALAPSSGNWNILGGPGVTTTGSGSTLTINSTVFTDTTALTMAVDNGYFATAAGSYNLPATAAQGELITIVCDTAGAVVVDAPALNFVRIGTLITSSGGTCTSTSQGDVLVLRYRLSSLTWHAVSVIGTWVVA